MGAAVYMPWKHEIYDVPSTLEPGDPRYDHYLSLSLKQPVRFDQNFHYFGAGPDGKEHNQLLSLVSIDWDAVSPHHKTIPAPIFNDPMAGWWTDLLGCHGTSGSGVLQPGAGGRYELLRPALAGSIAPPLCPHVPMPGDSGLVVV